MSSPSKWRLKRQHWCRRLLNRRVPITRWLPQYSSEKFVADLIAGVTVGLTVIPQALAYATLGGLEPQYGLYSSFVGCFVYALFGSCKDITIGPTALMALMTYQQVHGLTICVYMLLQYGLYSSFVGCFVYAFFGSCKDITIGPTALMALMTYQQVHGLTICVYMLLQYGLYSSFVGCFVYALFGSCKDITIGPTALMALMTYQQVHGLTICVYMLLQYGLYSSFVGCFVYALFGSCKDITIGPTALMALMTYQQVHGLTICVYMLLQYGLYSSFVGCFVYALFGSCKDITIGPTALMALMTYQQIHTRNTDFAVLLCFLTGAVQLLMGLLHLGVLIDFISIPVTVGFTSATSVIIAVSQIKSLLGLQFQSSGFLDTLAKVVTNIGSARWSDSLLGFSCIFILLLLRKLKDVSTTPGRSRLKKGLWLLATSRNALVVLCCSVLAYMLNDSSAPFQLTGTVRSGLPSISLPPFETTLGNRTLGFMEMCSELGTSIVLVPVIGVLGNVAIAKAFASSESVDATQELVTLSLCNVLGSLVGAMPVTGSFSRSAVNHASGVATQLGGIFTGILVLLALSLLTPYFFFIPKAALAAVVICAVIFMIEYEVVKPMWRSRRADLVPAVATFSLCLLAGVELGILAGVAVNVALLLYPSARPQLSVDTVTNASGTSYLLITLGNSMYFPGVEYIRQFVARAAKRQGSSSLPVVIDCRYVLGADFTAAKGICALASDLSQRGQPLLLLSPREAVTSVLSGAGSAVAVLDCIDDLEHTLADVTGQILMPLLNGKSDHDNGDMTPPPSYNSLPLIQEDETIEVVIPKEKESNTPLVTSAERRNLTDTDAGTFDTVTLSNSDT